MRAIRAEKVEATSGFEPLNRGFADHYRPARVTPSEHAGGAPDR